LKEAEGQEIMAKLLEKKLERISRGEGTTGRKRRVTGKDLRR